MYHCVEGDGRAKHTDDDHEENDGPSITYTTLKLSLSSHDQMARGEDPVWSVSRSIITWFYVGCYWIAPPYLLLRPPYLLLRPREGDTKDAPFSSALNYFGMFVMTFHYEWRLKLASVS